MDKEKNKIEQLKQLYNQFLKELAVLRKERKNIFENYSRRLDQLEMKEIEENLKRIL